MEQQKQLVEQNTLYGGMFGRAVHATMKGGRNLTAEAGDVFGGGPAGLVGRMSDSVGRMKDDIWYGSSIKNNSMTVDDALTGTKTGSEIQGFEINKLFDNYESKGATYMDRKRDSGKYGSAKGVAEQLNDAKNRGDADAIAYFKATDPKERQAALNRFKEGGKMSKTSNEHYSDPDNYKDLSKYLDGMSRSSGKEGEGWFKKALGAVGIGGKDAAPEKGADVLARVGGIKGADMADNARVAGRAYNAATGDRQLTVSNIEERMGSDENLKAISKATGITDPQELLKYIKKTAKGVADEQIVGLTTNSLKVKGSGAEALKAAGSRNGEAFYDENAINTKHLDYEETLNATMATKEKANMVGALQDKLKSGHLDFAGYQNSVNSLDNKETVTKFDKAVDKFVKSVDNKDVSTRKANDWGNLGGLLGKYPEGSGQSNQKVY